MKCCAASLILEGSNFGGAFSAKRIAGKRERDIKCVCACSKVRGRKKQKREREIKSVNVCRKRKENGKCVTGES